MARRPRKERAERKPREARAPRVLKGSGAVVFSFLRNTRANMVAASRHQLERVPDGSSEIDPSRSHRNRVLVGTGHILEDIKAYEANIDIRGHARDTAAPYLTLVLSASPEFFRPAGGPPGSEIDTPEDAARLEAWIAVSTDWAKDTFGPDLVSVIYNGDETTPHLHLAVVPTYSRRETIKPRRLIDEDPEAHALRIAEWQANGPRVQTRSWASNPVVGRNGSADLLRKEYAAAMEPMGLHYALASYNPQNPDDPVAARAFRDLQKAEAVEARKRAEARAAEAEAEREAATRAREEAEARAAAAEAELEAARAVREAEDARRARFTAEARATLDKRKAALAAERAAIDEERRQAAAEKEAIVAERDALRADGAILEAVVSGLEGGTLTHETTASWTRRNDNILKAAPRMWQRIMPFVRSLLQKQEEAAGAHREAAGLVSRVRAWLRRPDLPREARASAGVLLADVPEEDEPGASPFRLPTLNPNRR